MIWNFDLNIHKIFSFVLIIMEVEDTLEFVITIKRNGKLCHSFHSNDYVYRRKEVKASGVAYFVCTVDKCPMRLHARYTDKDAANTDEEPTILL